MRARDAVGRTIVAVEQERFTDQRGRHVHVDAFVLDNGTRLVLHPQEAENDPYVSVIVVRKGRRLTLDSKRRSL